MNNEATNNEVKIILEQKQNPIIKQDVCAAYLVEMVKRKNQTGSDDADLAKLREKKLLSIEETAELYGIGRSKLYELTNAENCSFVLWIGGHRKIKREAFEEYIMRQYSV